MARLQTKKLFIIGNGFDRYHDIQTSYPNFREYLEANNQGLLRKLEEFFANVDLWSNLESALAEFDADRLRMHLAPYGADDWSDADNHTYQNEIEKVVEVFSNTLKAIFTDWISQVEIPFRANVTNKLTYIDTNSIYLNFNYTGTLQKIYLVHDSNVLHIHGKIESPNADLILGHAWKLKRKLVQNEECDDPRFTEGSKLIEEYFKKTYKPTEKIIMENKTFFRRLNFIEEIYVLGHSMSEVDMPYFREIANSIDLTTTKWYISHHNLDDFVNHQQMVYSLGVPKNLARFSIIENIGMLNETMF